VSFDHVTISDFDPEAIRLIMLNTAIIKEDLELFKDIMDHRESSKLEWIIVLLILVEVVDAFVIRILNLF